MQRQSSCEKRVTRAIATPSRGSVATDPKVPRKTSAIATSLLEFVNVPKIVAQLTF